MGKSKPLADMLRERAMSIGKLKGKIVQVALPTGRRSVSFDHFCEMIADQTTFNYIKVASVLNLASEYFHLDDVSFERVAPRTKKTKKAGPDTGGGASNDHSGTPTEDM